ncbi:hypothetical protein KSP40_PGU018478 [Platanthera guangdongensis]|uniref:Uncharacterized protein n=1 Tax=Platanthera guangdongensis TaxID=2320717 RepID=A0ABR2LV25_9ASPA
MDFAEGSPPPASFDVDEWDENFINEVLQVELGLSSKNAVANPSDLPPTVNPSSSYLPEEETFQWFNPSPQTRSEPDVCFSPPRELSQRFREMPESVPTGNDFVKVDNRGLKNEVYSGVGVNRKNKEVERLKIIFFIVPELSLAAL